MMIHFIGRVTRVLDGHGYESDSGAHGHRGYNEHMMFTWIGAAVDIPFKVHKVLTTLGPRLYFLRVPKTRQESDDSYYQELQDNDFDSKIHEIQQALTDYQDYFEACPVMVHDDKFNSTIKKMPWLFGDGPNECQKKAYMHIIKLGKLLARLRGVVPTWHTNDTQGSEYGYTLPIIEEPNRAMRQLVNLARGHTLLKGRNYVNIEDIPMIVKVVLSTAPIERVTMFDILLAHDGVLNVNQITQSLDVSEPTARKTMLELKILGLVNMEKIPVPCSDGITRLALQIRLKDEFNWFLDEEFRTLREGFEPESSNSDNDDDDDDNDDNNSVPDPIAAPSSATITSKGRPKTDWNNLLENKAMEEKIPPEKGIENNADYSLQNKDFATNLLQDHDNMPLSGGKISAVAYSTEESSIINDAGGEIVIPGSIYRVYGDTWKCKNKNCNVKGDKWFMMKHPQYCRGTRDQLIKQNSELTKRENE
jgi:hypothetical protein